MPTLLVLLATAVSTWASHRLQSSLGAGGVLLDLVPFGGVVVATGIVSRRLRRHPIPLDRHALAAYSYFAGALVSALGTAHLVAITLVAVDRDLAYTFRQYSLVLLGVFLLTTGVVAANQADRLAFGRPDAWRVATAVWATILAACLPLVPLQGFAVLFSVLAAVALLLLGVTTYRARRNGHS